MNEENEEKKKKQKHKQEHKNTNKDTSSDNTAVKPHRKVPQVVHFKDTTTPHMVVQFPKCKNLLYAL